MKKGSLTNVKNKCNNNTNKVMKTLLLKLRPDGHAFHPFADLRQLPARQMYVTCQITLAKNGDVTDGTAARSKGYKWFGEETLDSQV